MLKCARLLAVAPLVMIAGCTTETERAREEKEEKEVESQAPSEIIWASDLCQAYGQNEIAATERFRDKVIIVAGAIDTIGRDAGDKLYVSFQYHYYAHSPSRSQLFGLKCMFADTNIPILSQLQPGQIVSIKGRVSTGYIYSDHILAVGRRTNVILLLGCTIVP